MLDYPCFDRETCAESAEVRQTCTRPPTSPRAFCQQWCDDGGTDLGCFDAQGRHVRGFVSRCRDALDRPVRGYVGHWQACCQRFVPLEGAPLPAACRRLPDADPLRFF